MKSFQKMRATVIFIVRNQWHQIYSIFVILTLFSLRHSLTFYDIELTLSTLPCCQVHSNLEWTSQQDQCKSISLTSSQSHTCSSHNRCVPRIRLRPLAAGRAFIAPDQTHTRALFQQDRFYFEVPYCFIVLDDAFPRSEKPSVSPETNKLHNVLIHALQGDQFAPSATSQSGSS